MKYMNDVRVHSYVFFTHCLSIVTTSPSPTVFIKLPWQSEPVCVSVFAYLCVSLLFFQS